MLFDVGHQAYVYKILTDREDRFHTIRTKGGLSPFLDPEESHYDHFISGHAGTALPAAVGFATANPDNGHCLEALNYIGYKKLENIVVIINDNEMSIGENVGFISKFLKRVIISTTYQNFRSRVKKIINHIRAVRTKRVLEKLENSIKNLVTPYYAIENFGFKFFNIADGHDIKNTLSILKKVRDQQGPKDRKRKRLLLC